MDFSFWLWLGTVCLVWYSIYHIIAFKVKGSLKGKLVLITGCDTGFGNILAKRLDSMGAFVFATCIGKETASALDESTSSNTRVLLMDVTKTDEINAAFNTVKQYCITHKCCLYGLVNNAGIAEAGIFECIPRKSYNKVIEVNSIGLMDVTRTFLPLMRCKKYNAFLPHKFGTKLLGYWNRGKGGRIINIASVAGRCAAPYMAPYCVSKFGVVAFTDCIRREFQHFFNIWCCTVEPFFVMTNILHNAFDLDRIKREMQTAMREERERNDGEEIDGGLEDVYDMVKYLDFKREGDKDIKKLSFTNTDLVIEAIICGLSSYFPLKSYHPSTISSVLYRMERYVLPEWLFPILTKVWERLPLKDSFLEESKMS